MKSYLTVELINPTAPASDSSPGTWSAIKEIYTKYDLEYKHTRIEIIDI